MARIRKARCGDGGGHDPLEDREAWGFGLLAVDDHGAGAGAGEKGWNGGEWGAAWVRGERATWVRG